ncbi:MAG: flagellar hook protein FlgE [Oryzihumus sp.]
MLRSLFSAVSGLRGHQTMMDVIGNNIANINTAGYKSSQVVFEDTLSQALKAAGSPQGTSGGTNPAQVGLGVRVGGIMTNFAQGATQMTGRSTDITLQGDGFFVVKQDGQTLYSRAGAFSFDALGNLVNPDGAIVQGWQADGSGNINPNAAMTGLKLPIGQIKDPKQTTSINVGGNLPSDAKAGDKLVSSLDIFDKQGKAIAATFTYTKQATADQWTVQITVPDPTDATKTVDLLNPATATINWRPGTQDFDKSSLDLDVTAANAKGYTFSTLASDKMTVGLGTTTNPLTQFASANTVSALDQNGSALGSLQSFTLSPDGTLLGIFSNGQKQSLGRVAVANFNNPPGLEKVGGSLYRDTSNSGTPAVGTAGSGGRGTLASGALEMSNVDLAQEFTNLVVAQRGFQANSRVVSASDEILQDLVNMKH